MRQQKHPNYMWRRVWAARLSFKDLSCSSLYSKIFSCFGPASLSACFLTSGSSIPAKFVGYRSSPAIPREFAALASQAMIRREATELAFLQQKAILSWDFMFPTSAKRMTRREGRVNPRL
jgi:hypothetical protein